MFRFLVWGSSGNLTKEQGSLELICSTKGPSVKDLVHRWLHSGMRIWAPSWIQRMFRVLVWGSSGNLAKEQGSLELICSTKGPSVKDLVHWDRKGSNSNANK